MVVRMNISERGDHKERKILIEKDYKLESVGVKTENKKININNCSTFELRNIMPKGVMVVNRPGRVWHHCYSVFDNSFEFTTVGFTNILFDIANFLNFGKVE